jgi:hypothetical protein
MKYWLIKWEDGIHKGIAIVQACYGTQAVAAFMEKTGSSINNSSKITSIEECPVSEVPTLITEIWI